jgi:hypothetical protein
MGLYLGTGVILSWEPGLLPSSDDNNNKFFGTLEEQG